MEIVMHNELLKEVDAPKSQSADQLSQILSQTAVVVPVLNAGRLAATLTMSLLSQDVTVNRIIILDSESDDGSQEVFGAAGFDVIGISRSNFDHGGTRNLALSLAPDAAFIVYLTQDAIPQPESLRLLLVAFIDSTVGLAYGRQLPRAEAGAIERHARIKNYPSTSMKRNLLSVSGKGIKGAFNSNSFAAYRRKALEEIGAFPERVIFGEDQIAAGRMLLAGWTVCYEARAAVIHSHGFSIFNEFRRYFDHGVAHAHHSWLIDQFGTASTAGLSFVRSELSYLLCEDPARIPEACIRTALKFAGYRLGRHESWLPRWLKKRFSLHRSYFSTERQ